MNSFILTFHPELKYLWVRILDFLSGAVHLEAELCDSLVPVFQHVGVLREVEDAVDLVDVSIQASFLDHARSDTLRLGKPWGQSARALSVLLQPGSIGEPRDASMCAEFAFVR